MYNKLFTKILDSSIWLEPPPTRIVWVTLLAAMDRDGIAHFASVANLAHRAVLPVPETEIAVRVLESPDSNSSDPDNEGRRIERIPGGWAILNAHKYRGMATIENERESTRKRVAAFRARKACNASGNGAVTPPSVSESVSGTLNGKPQSRKAAESAAIRKEHEQRIQEDDCGACGHCKDCREKEARL